MEEKITLNEYLKAQAKCGIKVGDTVKVLRKAEDGEQGWDNAWVGDMNDMIGRRYKVMEITGGGIQLRTPALRFTLGFPYFVLQKVK